MYREGSAKDGGATGWRESKGRGRTGNMTRQRRKKKETKKGLAVH
jgi:hypothetical protein